MMFGLLFETTLAYAGGYLNKCETPETNPALLSPQPKQEVVTMFVYTLPRTHPLPQVPNSQSSSGGAL